MFFNSGIKQRKYDVDYLTGDVSLHSGIPKQYYGMKNKKFGDWEIPPWELLIFKDKILGEVHFQKFILQNGEKPLLLLK